MLTKKMEHKSDANQREANLQKRLSAVIYLIARLFAGLRLRCFGTVMRSAWIHSKPRTHYYSQIDQIETKRNDKEYLNAHGLPAFKGQPGYCVNCHTGYLTALQVDGDYNLTADPTPAATKPMPFST